METKVCKACHEEKPLTEYYIRTDNNKPRPKCIKCLNAEQNQKKFAKLSPEKQAQIIQHRNQQSYLLQGLKECSRCSEVKPVTEYMTHAGKIEYSNCSICRPLTNKEYFAKNPDKQQNRHASVYTGKDFVASYTQPLKEAGCADCKKYFPDAMEFDHTCHPSEKTYDIARIYLAKGSSENLSKMLQTELAKGEYVCVNCHKIRTAKRANSSRVKYLSDPQDSSINAIAKYAYNLLTTESCIDCNENDFLVLEFDHIKGSKTANVSTMLRKPKTFSIEAVKEEITKCEIRCGNCHRNRTRARQRGEEDTLQKPKDHSLKICNCGRVKTLDALVCLKCRNRERILLTLERYGELEELLSRLRNSNFTRVGTELGVSGTAVKKYIKRRGIDPSTLLPFTAIKPN